jgi:thiamine pyrophosphate-dependent acetolactate synthase large subunit-like protein
MTFVPISKRCLDCNKLIHIVTADQKEVSCPCGAKYHIVKQNGLSLEKISSGAEKIEERSPWEKFTRANKDSNQNRT